MYATHCDVTISLRVSRSGTSSYIPAGSAGLRFCSFCVGVYATHCDVVIAEAEFSTAGVALSLAVAFPSSTIDLVNMLLRLAHMTFRFLAFDLLANLGCNDDITVLIGPVRGSCGLFWDMRPCNHGMEVGHLPLAMVGKAQHGRVALLEMQ